MGEVNKLILQTMYDLIREHMIKTDSCLGKIHTTFRMVKTSEKAGGYKASTCKQFFLNS